MKIHLNTPSFFPSPTEAGSDGIIGYTQDLDSRMLEDAYLHGIFPWPFMEDCVHWASPDPRGLLLWQNLHIPRRLKRSLPKAGFELKISENFEAVIRACATVPRAEGGTWITSKIIRAYLDFFNRGFVHCFETWHNGKLVGGMYGISLGKLFCGESMFHTETDASKFAFLSGLAALKNSGVELVDTQVVTNMTATFGAVEFPREEYLKRMRPLLGDPLPAKTLRKNAVSPEVLF